MSVHEEISGCLRILPVDKKGIKSSAHIYDADQALIADYPRYHSHSFRVSRDIIHTRLQLYCQLAWMLH